MQAVHLTLEKSNRLREIEHPLSSHWKYPIDFAQSSLFRRAVSNLLEISNKTLYLITQLPVLLDISNERATWADLG